MNEQIGTVQLLRDRVYGRNFEEVCVPPGTYPLIRRADGIVCWLMTGRINEHFEDLGDGLSVLHMSDRPTGPQTTVTSKTYTADEFAEFIATDPLVVGNEDERRLVVEVWG